MHKLTQVFVFAPLASLSTAALAQRPAPAVDGYAVFSEMRANAPVGSCNCFWMYGAHGGFSLPMWRDFSAVVEAGGHHNSQIPNFNTGLSIFYGMGGLRLRVANHTRFQPFGQGLFGGVHGFDSYFPAPVGRFPTSYDSSFALTVGGGSTSPSRDIYGYGLCRRTTSTSGSATSRATGKTSSASARVFSFVGRNTRIFHGDLHGTERRTPYLHRG